MTARAIIITLMLVLQQNSVIQALNSTDHTTSRRVPKRDQKSDMRCNINTAERVWSSADKNAAKIAVQIQAQGRRKANIMPSLHLVAATNKEGLDQNEYWAPFSLITGEKTKEWQEFETAHQKEPYTVHIFPFQLSWAPSKSSVWPDRELAIVVPPGEYDAEVRIEFKKGQPVISNRVRVTISR